jgi:hypothetical protein
VWFIQRAEWIRAVWTLGHYKMVSEPTFAAMGMCGLGAGHGVHCVCRLCGVHGVAHVPALGARSRVLRGNVPGYRCLIVGMLGPTRTSGSLRGVYVTPGPIWNLAHSGPCECYEIL